ncbi:OTU domain-containing protein 5-B-like isoform X2 [Lingula anatina]|uniref:ubiquitinyl hydrolase 1 n=1 Tax=Lingula anatina TaxID=7574 RepID=A0A1S3I2T1_LINAN|nr:OTU domain-containing protein 5-B-like isoform X1 [Lingula anatina]XP_013391659.1 OTU domain-containing protein 5-B-like isoform X2 [Lingula anatina]|eukprot:XP_013391658.1 OTU domain-containing protein 5-B-like isoform X1 [Lingula anatina]
MTILPKKKQAKEKNEQESGEHSQSHIHGHSSTTVSEQRAGRARNSPPRWSHTSSRDSKLTTHDPGGTFEEFESREGSSSHNKRRHRSPTHSHRSRKQRSESRPHREATGLSSHPSCSSQNTADNEELNEGYNSEDEYTTPKCRENLEELEQWFEAALQKKRHFAIKKMKEDGACLFRAVSDQVYGDQEMHSLVRKQCIDYMMKNADYFSNYVTEDFTTYLNRKRLDSCHGNHVEMQAMSELYNRPIEVYKYTTKPINTFHGAYKTENEPVRLSYHNNSHYNSVVDPYKATVGVGLGLPGFQPGSADKNLMNNAIKQSEDFHIEQTMLDDKMRETDWELTQETMEEQVARESYLQWLRENEKRAKGQASSKSASATCSSSSMADGQSFTWREGLSPVNVTTHAVRSPRNRSANNSGQNSPNRMDTSEALPSPPPPKLPVQNDQGACAGSPKPGSSGVLNRSPSPPGACGGVASFSETASIMNQLPPNAFNLSDWVTDDDDILAQVMAQSQQEYLDSLRKNAAGTSKQSSSSGNS